MTTLAQDAAELRAIYEARRTAKDEYDKLDREYKSKQAEFLDRMEAEEVDGIKRDGINFVPASTTYGQVTDRREFVEWAETHEPELIEPKEIGERINEYVRGCLDDGRALPPGLGFYIREYVSQRAA
jgi:hypothetical protein